MQVRSPQPHVDHGDLLGLCMFALHFYIPTTLYHIREIHLEIIPE
jgi:hypothetical protein